MPSHTSLLLESNLDFSLLQLPEKLQQQLLTRPCEAGIYKSLLVAITFYKVELIDVKANNTGKGIIVLNRKESLTFCKTQN